MKNKNKIFFISFVVLSFVLFSIYFFSIYNKKNLVDQKNSEELEDSEEVWNILQTTDIRAISTTLEVVLQDQGFKEVFLTKDRENLFEYSQPLFQKIKETYGITHFYFHLPDGTNFVRIHDKNKFGDKINRQTLKNAIDSKVVGSGIELGATAFALRVVKPYYDDGELIGYVELGQEINHFLKIIKDYTDNEYSLFVPKENLNHDSWKSVRSTDNLEDNWNNFSNLIEIDSTFASSSDCFTEANAQKIFSSKNSDKLSLGEIGKNITCSGFVFYDVSGKKIGVVLLSSDISSEISLVNNFIFQQIFFLLVLLVFVYFSSNYIFKKNTVIEQKFKYLFDNSQDAIMTLNPPYWKFTDGNNATLEIFGLKEKEELKSVNPGDLSPELQPDGQKSEEKAKKMIEIALEKGFNSFEWTHKKLNGPEFLANVSLARIKIGNDIFLQAVVKDITEQKKSIEKSAKTTEEIKKALSDSKKINDLMVGRELEMVKLKSKIAQLEEQNKK